jgi:hypothetical protein
MIKSVYMVFDSTDDPFIVTVQDFDDATGTCREVLAEKALIICETEDAAKAALVAMFGEPLPSGLQIRKGGDVFRQILQFRHMLPMLTWDGQKVGEIR